MKSINLPLCILVVALILASPLFSHSQEKSMDELVIYLRENLTAKWQELEPEMYQLRDKAEKGNSEQHKADAYNFLGSLHFRKSAIDSAIFYYEKASEINRELNNESALAKNLLNIGMAHRNLGNYDKTIEFSLEAARVFDQTKDYKGMAIVQNMIGSVYYYQDRIEEAIPAMEKYVEYSKLSGDTMELASAYQNLGSILTASGNYEQAAENLKLAYDMFEQKGNMLGMANNAINVGTIYLEQEEFDEAEVYFLKANELSEKLDNPRLALEVNINLAITHLNAGQNQQSLPYSQKVLEISREVSDKYFEMRALNNQAQAHYNLANYKLAFDLKSQSEILNQEIVNEENLAKIAELEALYENEKKENQILALEADRELKEITIQRNRVVQAGLGVSLVLLVIFGLLWQSRRQAKQREELEKVKVRLKEEQLLAVISSQETERKRFAEDLHDGFGQLISALKLNIGRLDANNPKPITSEERQTMFDNSVNILNEMYGEVRNIAFNLMPTVLVKKGLVSAVEQLVERFNSSGKVFFQVHAYDLDEKLSDLNEISLYRIVQEILNNIVKYADASQVDVQFVRHDDELVVTIEDNGRGFDIRRLEQGEGNGWKNIRSRLNLIKGEIEIDSHPNSRGSTYILNVPILSQSEQIIAV